MVRILIEQVAVARIKQRGKISEKDDDKGIDVEIRCMGKMITINQRQKSVTED
jgi:hypothetical protein